VLHPLATSSPGPAVAIVVCVQLVFVGRRQAAAEAVGAAVDAARRDDDSVASVQALRAALELGGATQLSAAGGGGWLWELSPQPDLAGEASAAAELEKALTLIGRALVVRAPSRSSPNRVRARGDSKWPLNKTSGHNANAFAAYV
jgi:hypothetical protein